jgi:3-hydroxyisobutyrate dehydrogenase-like beta-hydroxyacid dehydrogenase
LGRPMVEQLLAAGHRVTVFARNALVRSELADAGAQIVDSPFDAAASGEVIIACLFSDDQLVEVAHGPHGLLAGLAPGAVLASHVTGTRRTVHELADAAKSRGAHVLDAPVSGTADDIRAGTLTVLLGGDDEPVAACTSVMSSYADTVVHTGPAGSALAVKLVNNLMFAAGVQLAAAAANMGAALGLDPISLLSAITTCSGGSYAAGALTRFPDTAAFARIAAPFLRKDIAACEDELAAAGAQADLLVELIRRGPLDLTGTR